MDSPVQKEKSSYVPNKKGEKSVISFEGGPLGRSVDKPVNIDSYKTTVEIYHTRENSFPIYVTYRDKSGEINLTDFVKTDNL